MEQSASESVHGHVSFRRLLLRTPGRLVVGAARRRFFWPGASGDTPHGWTRMICRVLR